jgi:uncharacterized protein YjbI with pentapeptide repeats
VAAESGRLRAAGIVVTLGLATVLLAAPAGQAVAAVARPAAGDTVTCPSVGPSGQVSISPEPEIDWSGCDLAGADLASAPLGSADLSDATLTGANLTSADVDTVNFGGADLSGANLTSADLDWASLTNANLSSADFDDAYLNSAVLTGSAIGQVNFTATSLTNLTSGGLTGGSPAALPASWSLAAGYLIGPTAIMNGADFAQLDLHGIDLAGGSLANADLDGADLSDADLDGDSLAGDTMTDTNLTGADLAGVTLTNTNLSSANLDMVSSGDITGNPSSLPVNWSLALPSGYLLGPDADLADATMFWASISGADLASADLSDAVLEDANVSYANLAGANLNGADLTNASVYHADLTSADLVNAGLSYGNLDYANFTTANLTGADLRYSEDTGATWSDTTCPDGTNSDQHAPLGCTTPLDKTPPAASPVVGKGTAGDNGWYKSSVTVDWHWTDTGTINRAECTTSSTTSGNGAQTLTATCTDDAGNKATASYHVKVDASLPVVSVTGVSAGQTYIYGEVPAIGCHTAEAISGVARNASVKVSTSGRNGAGAFTATCAGAVSQAGTIQASAVLVRYEVAYGFGGFGSPAAGATLKKSARTIAVRFRLANAEGTPIPADFAAALGKAGDVRVTLRGPRITQVVTCAWAAASRVFECTVPIPAGVGTGHKHPYTLTASDNLGSGFLTVPVVGRAVNPQTIYFR